MIALICLLLWLFILGREVFRWKKQENDFKLFQKGKPPWLTFFLIGFLQSFLGETQFHSYFSNYLSDAVLLFILESIVIAILALSPHLILLGLKKLSNSFKHP